MLQETYKIAERVHTFGANVLPVDGKQKRPFYEWALYQKERIDDLSVLPWKKYDAVSMINGVNLWRSIDIDAIKLPDGTKKPVDYSTVVSTLLVYLGLPNDYKWIARSVSGTGYHIWFLSDGELPETVTTGSKWDMLPRSNYKQEFAHLELRWSATLTQLPMKDTEWVNGAPNEVPAMLDVQTVTDALFVFVELPEPKIKRQEDEDQVLIPVGNKDYVAKTALRAAINKSVEHGRNNLGHWLATALRDNGFDEDEMTTVMEKYQNEVDDPANPYTMREALSTIKSVMKKERGEPWTIATKEELPHEKLKALLNYNRTDAGNAERFALLYGDNVRFNHTDGYWYIFNGSKWQIDKHSTVMQYAINMARALQKATLLIDDPDERKRAVMFAIHSENSKNIANMLTIAETLPQMAADSDMFDRNTMLVAVNNGTLDLSTGTFRESRREDYITKSFNVDYDPSATAPRWEQFVSEVFNGDQDLIKYVQRAVGYSITGSTAEQVLFLLHGNGANGKSTFLETLTLVISDYADTTAFSTFDAGTRSEMSNDLAKLKGARYVTIIEANEDRVLNEAKVKSVTGSDRITCRYLRKEFFTYMPQFKIWLAVNRKPAIRGTDDGIWRRIHLIPFTQSFKDKPDLHLSEKLQNEVSGILNWILEGLKQWNEQGLNPPAIIKAQVEEYRNESDTIGKWLEERCTLDKNENVTVADAYEDYSQWMQANGEHPLSTRYLTQRLQERGIESKVTRPRFAAKTARCYIGMYLTEHPPQ